MKIYLAGKITGDPNYREKFAAAADYVKSQRPEAVVLNPAVLPEGLTEQDYMTITGQMLAAADEMMCLPDWEKSDGARIEVALARKTGKQVSILPEPTKDEYSPDAFYEAMREIACDDDYDEERAHGRADALMCATLEALGYGAGVKVFEEMPVWYS